MWECKRCNESGTGTRFDQHTCKGMRNLEDLGLDLLRKVIQGTLSEDEAWAILDKEGE